MSSSKNTLAEKIRGTSGQLGLGKLMQLKTVYNFAVDGGAVSTITPKTGNVLLPANAVIVGGTINSTTAVLSAGASTMSVGTSAGSSATSILAATGKASMSANALINAVPTFAAPVKLSAKGYVTVTIGTAAQTAGVVEIVLYYYVAQA